MKTKSISAKPKKIQFIIKEKDRHYFETPLEQEHLERIPNPETTDMPFQYLFDDLHHHITQRFPKTLTEIQQRTLELFFQGKTQAEICDELSCCQTNVHKILFGNKVYHHRFKDENQQEIFIRLTRPYSGGGILSNLQKFLLKDPECLAIIKERGYEQHLRQTARVYAQTRRDIIAESKQRYYDELSGNLPHSKPSN